MTTLGFTRNKLRCSVNENFFNIWTPQMAYVLGFTFADGNIYKTSLSWDIQKKDQNLLRQIKYATDASYPIKTRPHGSCRLRISNQLFIAGAINKGLLHKKNIRNTLPQIPKEYLPHFVRGYLDGDGWITVRNNKSEVDMGFSSGNKDFLVELNLLIAKIINIKPANIRTRIKLTPRKVKSTTYMFEYYCESAYKVANWLFDNLSKSDLFLKRKYFIYKKAKNLYEFLTSTLIRSRKYRMVQKVAGQPLPEVLSYMHFKLKLNGVQIAQKLHVHPSSIYRWLARTGIKYPQQRILYG